MAMLQELKQREKDGSPIQVGLIGAGAMGLGIAYQVGKTPGMQLSFVADLDPKAAEQAAALAGGSTRALTDGMAALQDPAIPCDVFVESTNAISAAFDYCMAAIERNAHCILMNAEVDAIFGFLLREEARKQGVVVTSDAGDQHGVLARMMEEIEMWDFEIIQAGNMKGFLDRHQTLEGIADIARKLNLSVEQCLAYTDGSKLNIEMSIIANEYGLTPFKPGMEGPRADKVQQVLDLFDFDAYQGQGRIDYILGASEHPSGVYVVGRCDSEFQQDLLNYYKVTNQHPYYVFLRPYHLCHLETPRAIALAALYGKAVCNLRAGRVTDTFAFAKKNLATGESVQHAIGGDQVYGLVEATADADPADHVPQGLLHIEGQPDRATIKRTVEKDVPLSWDDVDIPANPMTDLWERQKPFLSAR